MSTGGETAVVVGRRPGELRRESVHAPSADLQPLINQLAIVFVLSSLQLTPERMCSSEISIHRAR